MSYTSNNTNHQHCILSNSSYCATVYKTIYTDLCTLHTTVIWQCASTTV